MHGWSFSCLRSGCTALARCYRIITEFQRDHVGPRKTIKQRVSLLRERERDLSLTTLGVDCGFSGRYFESVRGFVLRPVRLSPLPELYLRRCAVSDEVRGERGQDLFTSLNQNHANTQTPPSRLLLGTARYQGRTAARYEGGGSRLRIYIYKAGFTLFKFGGMSSPRIMSLALPKNRLL